MTSLDGGPATKSLQGRVTFGVSRLWIPHVALIGFIYYVLLSPQRHAENQSVFWILGTYTRNLVGGRVVNAGVAVMWVVHLFEAGYTVFLARRYETSLVVGISYVLATLVFGRPGWEELSNRARESSTRGKVA